jgi:NAD(P)-dependent dehydrogenase (short-subunit alcohol dehydrogenase family)
MTNQPRTVFVTGVNSGLGRAFAAAALGAGHRVVGTVRRPEDVESFADLHPRHAHVRLLDVTDERATAALASRVEDEIGPIDVLIANAGYGHEGLLEESSLDELRRQFEVNVFGAVATIKAVLPAMRARRRGHILAVTSIGGLVTSPGLSFYHGSKFALEGILESLGKEVAALGIHVTAIEPGPFRTDWSGRSMTHATRTIHDYDESYEPVREARAQANGRQPGDPEKAATAVMEVIAAETPPRHLLLGASTPDAVRAAHAALDDDISQWEHLTRAVDFDDSA